MIIATLALALSTAHATPPDAATCAARRAKKVQQLRTELKVAELQRSQSLLLARIPAAEMSRLRATTERLRANPADPSNPAWPERSWSRIARSPGQPSRAESSVTSAA